MSSWELTDEIQEPDLCQTKWKSFKNSLYKWILEIHTWSSKIAYK